MTERGRWETDGESTRANSTDKWVVCSPDRAPYGLAMPYTARQHKYTSTQHVNTQTQGHLHTDTTYSHINYHIGANLQSSVADSLKLNSIKKNVPFVRMSCHLLSPYCGFI